MPLSRGIFHNAYGCFAMTSSLPSEYKPLYETHPKHLHQNRLLKNPHAVRRGAPLADLARPCGSCRRAHRRNGYAVKNSPRCGAQCSACTGPPAEKLSSMQQDADRACPANSSDRGFARSNLIRKAFYFTYIVIFSDTTGGS